MLKRLEEIERELMSIYTKAKKDTPNLQKISFEIQEFIGGPSLWGCFHIGNDCRIYNNISELAKIIGEARERREKNEILYQRFEGIL